ncbi:MAG: rhomboid family intramembrane serine protease [Saprospiraceae bacterium]|nr:rhomboid family intramembrane serine protease [Saprospiraceae bacterium]
MALKFNSPVILGFSLICTLVYFGNIFMLNSLLPFFTVYDSVNWSNPFSIVTLVTHSAGHGSVEHLLGNLTLVLLLGPIIEEKYGSNNTLFMMVFTALITGLINVFFFNSGLLGASGIVFMFILLVSFTNVKAGQIPVTFILVAALFIGKEVLNTLQTNQISEAAHIIGGICGSLFGFTLGSGRTT